MTGTLAFDVYGTLVDPTGIVDLLREDLGEAAPAFADRWRSKQLEYLFRRGLGRKYQPFGVCTREAFDFTCLATGTRFGADRRALLLQAWSSLPAYPEARTALAGLRAAGWRCFAFSNGEAAALQALLGNADLLHILEGVVFADEVRTYKPDPSFYAHFLENTGALLGQTWLVSGNAFDVLGALEVGWKAAWVRRSPSQVFDPWGVEPTATVADLAGLQAVLRPA